MNNIGNVTKKRNPIVDWRQVGGAKAFRTKSQTLSLTDTEFVIGFILHVTTADPIPI